jgi:hypothetical protein
MTKIPKKADVDMSDKAVTGRLETVRALYKLARSLMSIDLSKAVPAEPKRDPNR